MAFDLVELSVEHASAAAEIHAEGQPGTFLTSLGPAFLRALYAEMAASQLCYGAVVLGEAGQVVGVVVGTTDSGQVFKRMIWRRGWRLAPSVAWALLKKPTLLKQIWETLSYPDQAEGVPGEAELFFIGTRSTERRQGIGAALFDALARESRERGMRALGLVVDAANDAAQRFYLDRGMRNARAMTLYSRTMYWFEMSL